MLGGMVAAIAVAGTAGAYWGTIGTGSGTAPVATLAGPTLTGSAGAGTATLTWTVVAPLGSGTVSYFVKRNGGAPAGDCPTQAAPSAVLTCTDSGLTRGVYSYTATAVVNSWTAASSSLPVTLASGVLDHLVLAAATTTPAAGAADSLTITAADAAGNTVAAYTGSHYMTFSGAGANGSYLPTVSSSSGTATTFGTATPLSFTNGVAAVSGASNGVMRLYKVETVNIVVGDGSGHTNGTGLAVTVVAGPLASFAIPTPAGQVAGVAFSVSITARDAYGSTATGYTGVHCLAFSGAAASPGGTAPAYPAQGSCAAGQSAVTFASGVAASVPVTLYNASAATTLTVTDGSLSASTGSFAVTGAAISRLSLTAATTTPAAGAPNNLTIRAIDAFGNVATGYTGSHSMAFTGATAVPNSPFGPTVTNAAGTAQAFGAAVAITFVNGVATVSGSSNGVMRLYRGGAFSILVGDGTYTNGPGLALTVTVVATAVSAGAFHTCAVLSYGGIECWGINNYGQLGNGTVVNSSTPVAVSGITNAIAVSAGRYQTCALLSDSTVRCWGRNNFGQLGDGTTTQRNAPVQVLAVGGAGGLSAATAISAGGDHTCALISGGGVDCWGRNNYGQLGDGTTTQRTTPVQVHGVGGVGNLTGISVVSSGMSHTCAVVTDGTARCWGYNGYGQLGDATTTQRTTPVQVHGVGGAGNLTGVATISGGMYHTCVADTDGTVECWGRNNDGQLGDGSTTQRTSPVAVSGIATATGVSAGMYHTCARLANGTAGCWGFNGEGQLGDGTLTLRTAPVQVSGLANATQVSSGGGTGNGTHEHTAALRADGSVVCWGDNTYGQLGNGTNTDSPTAVTANLQ